MKINSDIHWRPHRALCTAVNNPWRYLVLSPVCVCVCVCVCGPG